MAAQTEFEKKAQRVETLVHEVEGLEDENCRRSALDTVQALLELHGHVLDRMLELAGPEVAGKLADDQEVGALLLVHGLHPLTLAERVARSLDDVRPYLASHKGGVEVLGTGDGVVRLRLEGTCHGCPSSTATLKNAIEKAILEGAPDVARIEVEGVTEPPPSGFVPLGSIKGPALTCPDGLATRATRER
jgi:Fe-S cluster biogenesis protein NfuA